MLFHQYEGAGLCGQKGTARMYSILISHISLLSIIINPDTNSMSLCKEQGVVLQMAMGWFYYPIFPRKLLLVQVMQLSCGSAVLHVQCH